MTSLLILTFPNFSYAKNYLMVVYPAKTGASLKTIVMEFLKDGIDPFVANESLVITMKKNPSIKSWNPLKSDTTFKLYLDPSIVDLKKYNYYYVKHKQSNIHHLNVFTLPSIGFFTQSNNNGYDLSYTQISLISIGLGYSYAPYKTPVGMSSSFYYSTIASTSNQISGGQTSSVEIPAEYGANVYGIYKPELSQLSYFGGLDFESFSSFNIEHILGANTIAIDTNNIYYLTAGLNFAPVALENFNFKLSISKSILTNSANAINTTQPIKFTGIKMLLFISYQLNEKWSANLMVKNHNFSGDNDLSIKRFGLGLNYSFF